MPTAGTQEVLSTCFLSFPLFPSPQNKELISQSGKGPKTAVSTMPPLRAWVSFLPGACFLGRKEQISPGVSGTSSHMEDSNPGLREWLLQVYPRHSLEIRTAVSC